MNQDDIRQDPDPAAEEAATAKEACAICGTKIVFWHEGYALERPNDKRIVCLPCAVLDYLQFDPKFRASVWERLDPAWAIKFAKEILTRAETLGAANNRGKSEDGGWERWMLEASEETK